MSALAYDREAYQGLARACLPLHRGPPGDRAEVVEESTAARDTDQRLPSCQGRRAGASYEVTSPTAAVTGDLLPGLPDEQYIADAKIDSLYEGTTAIQAQDFFFRKIVRDEGEVR